jgi:hypothetical protein
VTHKQHVSELPRSDCLSEEMNHRPLSSPGMERDREHANIYLFDSMGRQLYRVDMQACFILLCFTALCRYHVLLMEGLWHICQWHVPKTMCSFCVSVSHFDNYHYGSSFLL